jgi:hypothetical protein
MMTMAKEPKKLDELFHDTLKDIYYAEKKILTALPKMAKAAQNEDLAAAFEKHEGETEEHVARLEQVFEEIEEKPQGKKCAAIEGILDEGKEIITRDRPLSMLVWCQQPKRSSTTRFAATEHSLPGPKSLASRIPSRCSSRRSLRKKPPTRLCQRWPRLW